MKDLDTIARELARDTYYRVVNERQSYLGIPTNDEQEEAEHMRCVNARIETIKSALAAYGDETARHWKANHDEAIRKLRLLTDRTDLPVDRTRAYEYVKELEAQVAKMREALDYLIGMCENCDWSNGVTDPTGTIDEGNALSARAIE